MNAEISSLEMYKMFLLLLRTAYTSLSKATDLDEKEALYIIVKNMEKQHGIGDKDND